MQVPEKVIVDFQALNDAARLLHTMASLYSVMGIVPPPQIRVILNKFDEVQPITSPKETE